MGSSNPHYAVFSSGWNPLPVAFASTGTDAAAGVNDLSNYRTPASARTFEVGYTGTGSARTAELSFGSASGLCQQEGKDPLACFAKVPANRRSSSSWKDRATNRPNHVAFRYAPDKGVLGSVHCWRSNDNKEGEWYQMDMGKTVVGIRGVHIAGEGASNNFIKTFELQHSTDNVTWASIADSASAGTGTGGTGGVGGALRFGADDSINQFLRASASNREAGLAVYFPGGMAITARYVRVVAKTWQGSVAGRFDVLLCEPDTPGASKYWELIDGEKRCGTNDDGIVSPSAMRVDSVSDLTTCREACAETPGCVAVDWALNSCVLFEKPCSTPKQTGKGSAWRLKGLSVVESPSTNASLPPVQQTTTGGVVPTWPSRPVPTLHRTSAVFVPMETVRH